MQSFSMLKKAVHFRTASFKGLTCSFQEPPLLVARSHTVHRDNPLSKFSWSHNPVHKISELQHCHIVCFFLYLKLYIDRLRAEGTRNRVAAEDPSSFLSNGYWSWLFTSVYCQCYECVELYFHPPYILITWCLSKRWKKFTSYISNMFTRVSQRYDGASIHADTRHVQYVQCFIFISWCFAPHNII
jgi:hypothetical protein